MTDTRYPAPPRVERRLARAPNGAWGADLDERILEHLERVAAADPEGWVTTEAIGVVVRCSARTVWTRLARLRAEGRIEVERGRYTLVRLARAAA